MGIASNLSLAELSERSGVPARTIRQYIARGLLEGTTGRGPGASYPAEDLDRLRFVQRLRAEFGLTLDAIRGVMGQLDQAQIRRVGTGEEEVVALPLAGGARPASEPVRGDEVRGPEGEGAAFEFRERGPRSGRVGGTSMDLKRVGVVQIEEAIARALEELTGERLTVQVGRVDFGSGRHGGLPAGVASMQVDVISRVRGEES